MKQRRNSTSTFQPTRLVATFMVLLAAQLLSLGTIAQPPDAASMTSFAVEGRVVYRCGDPAPGVGVTVSNIGLEPAVSRADGTFTLTFRVPTIYVTPNPRGTQDVEIAARYGSGNRQRVLVEATIPGDPIRIELPFPNIYGGPLGDRIRDPAAGQEMKAMYERFERYAREHEDRYPPLMFPALALAPDFGNSEEEFDDLMSRFRIGDHIEWIYPAYALTHGSCGIAFLDCLERGVLPRDAGLYEDVSLDEGKGSGGGTRILRLFLGIERFFLLDMGQGPTSAEWRGHLPILWERPASRDYKGAHVLYMNGDVRWHDYPGPFPVSREFTARMKSVLKRPRQDSITR
jgi:hypothetical protein